MPTTLNPILTATPGLPPTHNFGICETFSYIPVAGAGRPLYARASYITNFSDMSIHLSAGELSIGAVTIKDNNTGLNCDVVSDPDNNLNALRVITQDLESTYDDITIGDKTGLNYATIDGPLSSLNVKVTNLNVLESNTQNQITLLNSLTSLTLIEFNETQTLIDSLTSLNQKEFNETQTLINSLTSLQESKQNQIITLLHQLTANTDELEINTDAVETLLNSLTSLNQKEFNETQTLIDSLTSLNQKEFNETQTLLNSLTGLQDNKQNQIITLLHQLTANTDEIEINLDNLEINTDGVETLLNSLTSLNQKEFNETQTLLNSLTSLTLIEFNETQTLIDSLTSLNQKEFNETQTLIDSLTSLNQKEFNETQTLLNSLTSIEDDKQNQIITLLHQLTANTDEIEINIDGVETLLNSLTALTLIKFNETQTLIDSLTSKDFATSLKQDEQITLLEQLTSIIVTNPVEIYTTQTLPVSGFITVTNPITSVEVSNSIALKDLNNNNVTVTSATSSLNVNVTNPIEVTVNPSGSFPVTFAHTPNFDAFGRLRTSSPLTLFDSSHRYRDNNLWSSLTSVGGTYSFNPNQGLIEMAVNNLSGSSVIRETTKVFSYQPGKSLLTLNTFVMAPSATNLRQRVGYFGQDNGMYFQLDGGVISFVERSLVNGSPSIETIVPLSAWNGDKLDGTGPSKLTLDITKAQILWMDVEWLGLGTVRMGFVINGQFIVCHSFHHANIIASTYITTASLPLRYEITNKEATDSSHTLKQVCSTVISEGGYELRGLQQAISIPINAPRTFAVANTYYPIISIRLKTSPDRLDAAVILTALSVLGRGNGIDYNWQVRASGVTSGGSWINAGTDSAVEYNISGTSYTGGRILASGFLNSSNQGSPNLDILKEALFKFQLERNNLTKTPYEITLVAATDTENGSGMFASMDWEEISR